MTRKYSNLFSYYFIHVLARSSFCCSRPGTTVKNRWNDDREGLCDERNVWIRHKKNDVCFSLVHFFYISHLAVKAHRHFWWVWSEAINRVYVCPQSGRANATFSNEFRRLPCWSFCREFSINFSCSAIPSWELEPTKKRICEARKLPIESTEIIYDG